MIEDIINALQNYRLNKTRTFLSLLGVIIGVASVIVVTTLGQSASKNIVASFGDSGLDLIEVRQGFRKAQPGQAPLVFNDALRTEFEKSIPGIKNIYYSNNIGGSLRYDSTEISVSIAAVEYGYIDALAFDLEKGNLFSVSDTVVGTQNIILGSKTAESLFPYEDPIGKTIFLLSGKIRYGFTVIGVLKSKTGGFDSPDNSAFVTRGFYTKKIEAHPTGASMTLQIYDQNKSPEIVKAIEAFIEKKTGTADSVFIISLATMLDQFNDVMKTINLLLSGIAGISLLVGGIGIMNIMIVTVTERKKEIGIRKALGATGKAIRSQFLVEAAVITLSGGILGIFFGLTIGASATYFLKWKFVVSMQSIGLSFLVSVLIGVFFGFHPASRAAKLDPVQALASE